MKRPYDLGILGGGQLARMSTQAAQRMGLKVACLEHGTDTPAGQITTQINGFLTDSHAIAEIMELCDYLTLENEFVPAHMIRSACEIAGRDENCILPGIDTLETIQDKLLQRQAYARFGAPTPRAVPINPDDPKSALDAIGFPCVLKARFGGYDGKGTRAAMTPPEFVKYEDLWLQGGWLLEEFVPFRRELAVMVYRSKTETGVFPTMETIQTNHVCDLVFPSGTDASAVAISAVEAVDGYGLFGVELFETESGDFLINEIAPRPHNTGHFTLDWGGISQFEQHVRLAMHFDCEKPIGQECAMANLLGIDNAINWKNGLRQALNDVPNCHVHWYGKSESRPGRKMGHINVQGENCRKFADLARESFYRGWAAPGPDLG